MVELAQDVLEPSGMSVLVWSGEGIRRNDVVLEPGVPTMSSGACTTISMCDGFPGLHIGCYRHVSTRILDYSDDSLLIHQTYKREEGT